MVRWLLIAKGFCMGMADLVPGVSGGTMAFILGIYEQLLAAIRSFDTQWLKACLSLNIKVIIQRPHFGFILPLLAGLFLAVWFFTHIISLPMLIHNYPEQVYGLFFGLILASIYVLMQELKGFNKGDALTLVIGTVGGLIIVNLVPVETPDASWFIFLSGMIAISAMILPGISGSFLLLLLKKYSTILAAVGALNLSVLIPFLLGVVTGLASFSRLLGYLLKHFYQRTLLVIKGILLASLWVLWPYQTRLYETVAGKQKFIGNTPELPAWNTESLPFVVVLMLAGLAIVLLIHYMASKKR